MRGSIRQRAQTGGWDYIIDIGMHPAQRCQACDRRFWLERRPKESCPKCGGDLRETDERRRETKGGFATRKECVAAMNRLLVSVEERNHVLPTRATLREYLTKEWLPAIKATVRSSTYESYVQHVQCHISPHIGSIQLQKLSAAQPLSRLSVQEG